MILNAGGSTLARASCLSRYVMGLPPSDRRVFLSERRIPRWMPDREPVVRAGAQVWSIGDISGLEPRHKDVSVMAGCAVSQLQRLLVSSCGWVDRISWILGWSCCRASQGGI